MLKAVAAAPKIHGPVKSMPLMPGVEIDGAFRVESKLGSGAMGVVYLATDLALDRPVALKIHAAAADELGTRMWREAKAMARLSHPNVLTVYEVGTYQDRVFIAMELVDGGTLREWLKTRRPWEEIVAVFVQAAKGLAAAHEVGLVHRDFKPTNVLIGKDGRVRVADFGLARSMDAVEHEPSERLVGDSRDPSPSLEHAVTATGALVGTPFYMAPELRDGSGATQRADQYSFWLSLSEALSGARPGPKTGEDRDRAALGTVPTHIRAALSRGLRDDPHERFPSMRAVIDVLTAGTPRGRKVALLGAAAAIVVGGGFGVRAWTTARGEASCRERANAIDEVLGLSQRMPLDQAFRQTQLPYAANVLRRMAPQLDAYAEGWRGAFTDTCIATEVEQTAPPESWDATQACLRDRKEVAETWMETMADAPDEGVVRDAVTAAGRLAPLEVCTDRAWLSRHPAGDAPGSRESRLRLREAGAMFAAGRAQPAMDHVKPLLDEPDDRLRAEALVLAGEIGLELGDAETGAEQLRTGFELAVAHRLDDLALEASTELVYATGSDLHRYEEAHLWARTARSFLRRLDSVDSRNAAALHQNVGIVYEAEDRIEEGLVEHQKALDLYEAHLAPGNPELAFAHNNLGTSLLSLGKTEEAAVYMAEATALLEGAFGSDHPSVGLGFNNLAMVYKRQGKVEDAEQAQRRAIAIFTDGLGAEHPRVPMLRANLASNLIELERYDEAEAELEEALRIATKVEGAEGRSAGLVHHQLGNLFLASERFEDGLRQHAKALAISVANEGAQNPRAATSHFNVGRAHLGLGDREAARVAFETALAINVEVRGPDHPQTKKIRTALESLDSKP